MWMIGGIFSGRPLLIAKGQFLAWKASGILNYCAPGNAVSY